MTQEHMAIILDSTALTLFISVVTLWALIGDDLRIIFTDRSYDTGFYLSFLICFLLFTIEILCSCYSKENYMWGFFFFLDVISTLSILLDVGWISDIVFSGGDGGSNDQVARAAKASRIGARAARLLRILRLIRLIRIVKLYKAAANERKERNKKKESGNKSDTDMKVNSKIKEGQTQNQLPLPISSSRNVRERERSKQDLRNDGEVPPYHVRRNVRLESINVLQNSSVVVPGEKLSPEEEEEIQNDLVEFEFELKVRDERIIQDAIKETEVGRKVTSNITKILISLIMLIMVSVPLFANETYSSQYTDQETSIDLLSQ